MTSSQESPQGKRPFPWGCFSARRFPFPDRGELLLGKNQGDCRVSRQPPVFGKAQSLFLEQNRPQPAPQFPEEGQLFLQQGGHARPLFLEKGRFLPGEHVLAEPGFQG